MMETVKGSVEGQDIVIIIRWRQGRVVWRDGI